MAVEYVLLVVEGPHDVAFVGRILRKLEGFQRIQRESDLDSFWSALVPRAYPPDGDLLKRVPVPSFFRSPEKSVAVRPVVGDSKIAVGLAADLATLGQADDLAAVGLVLDSDASAPSERHESLVGGIRKKAGFDLPDTPGVVMGKPRRGVFILPNNQDPGTLESVLVECAESAYPNVLNHARAYVAQCEGDSDFAKLCEAFQNESYRRKALVGAIANVLKPCKAVQTSIEDNDWISPATQGNQHVSRFHAFLRQLLGIQSPDRT
jgi:hypothetical protein